VSREDGGASREGAAGRITERTRTRARDIALIFGAASAMVQVHFSAERLKRAAHPFPWWDTITVGDVVLVALLSAVAFAVLYVVTLLVAAAGHRLVRAVRRRHSAV
jgi:hypothetical protein